MRGHGHIFDDPEKLALMLSLYVGGWRTTHLAAEFDCDHTSIMHQVKKNGVWHRQVILMPARRAFRVKHRYASIKGPFLPFPIKIMSPHKYEHIFEELSRPGKSYKQYLKEQEARDGSVERKERLMERLREEKRQRDAKIARGEIRIFEDKEMSFNPSL